jgi:2'-5' RNA ligase
MKSIQKYFLAIIPPEPFISKYNEIKEEISRQFSVKYALKSPPHITLKMPFSFNEAKEEYLLSRISSFLENQERFPIQISGIGSFGERVIFQKISQSAPLSQLQSELKSFCKRELHLVDELSDRNFHPHLTLAFKDLKSIKFKGIMDLCNELQFNSEFLVDQLILLKRIEGRWVIFKEILFGSIQK